MKKNFLNLVAFFEMATGLLGLVWAVGGLIGLLPHGVAAGLWYGAFPVISLLTGIMFWRRWRTALSLSYLVMLLQIVAIQTAGFSLNLTGPINLTISAIWKPRAGFGGAVIGVNLVALGVGLLL